jgi:hypothetical protein
MTETEMSFEDIPLATQQHLQAWDPIYFSFQVPQHPPPRMSASLQLLSPEDARELFLWRWKDVSRTELNEHLKEFKKFDLLKTGELEENHAMMLLEARGETKTARELRETFARIDVNNNHKLSFLEWSCYLYNKDFQETNSFVDADARNAAMAEVQRAGEAARAIEEAAAKAKADEEEAARLRAAELERESQLVLFLLALLF